MHSKYPSISNRASQIDCIAQQSYYRLAIRARHESHLRRDARVLMLNYPQAAFRDCLDFAIRLRGQAGKPASQTLINHQHHERRGKTRTFAAVPLQVIYLALHSVAQFHLVISKMGIGLCLTTHSSSSLMAHSI
jgi:hypothetical protein